LYALYRMVLFPVTSSVHQLPQTTPFSTFCVPFHIFVTGRVTDFNFGMPVDRRKS